MIRHLLSIITPICPFNTPYTVDYPHMGRNLPFSNNILRLKVYGVGLSDLLFQYVIRALIMLIVLQVDSAITKQDKNNRLEVKCLPDYVTYRTDIFRHVLIFGSD